MESVVRGTIVYVFIWLVLRLAGKRTLSETTTFDLLLLLIISETIQEAMIDHDNSLINGVILVITLVFIDIAASLWKRRSKTVERIMDGVPLLIFEHGKPIADRMAKARIDMGDIMTAARETQGLERAEQIRYAVLEPSGNISIIPDEKE